LDRAGVSFVYQAQGGGPNSDPGAQLMASTVPSRIPPAMPKDIPPPGEPTRLPKSLLQRTAVHDPSPIRAAPDRTAMSPAETATLEELIRRQAGGARIVCVVNPRVGPSPTNPSAKSRSVALDRSAAATLSRIAAELGSRTAEVVSIIRSPSRPGAKSEIIVLDQASGAFLHRLGAEINAAGGVKIAQR
ncbi:MAG: hypothetical protein U9N87_10500, partial [Planctomycetota bacterium]|nr:hypothetical protein [Planctomycetota bacterium]